MIVPDPPVECTCDAVEVDQGSYDVTGRVVVTCLRCGRRWDDYSAWFDRDRVIA